jgi:hypothetical protein
MQTLLKPGSWLDYGARAVATIILLQTLFFKFTGAPESVYIFTKVGIEPWGRIASGVVEFIACVLLFVPGLTWLGAMLTLGVIGGAIFTHLTVLGIVVMSDGGLLFALAVVCEVCAAIVAFIHRHALPLIGDRL